MTPRFTATAALRAFRVLSVECRPVSERSSRGRHLIVYGSTLTKQRQYGFVLQPDAAALAPQHFNWQVQSSFLRRQSEDWEYIWIHPWRWVLTLVGLPRAVMPSLVSSMRLNHLCHIKFSCPSYSSSSSQSSITAIRFWSMPVAGISTPFKQSWTQRRGSFMVEGLLTTSLLSSWTCTG